MPFRKKWGEIVCTVVSFFLSLLLKYCFLLFFEQILKIYFTTVAFKKILLLEIMVESRRYSFIVVWIVFRYKNHERHFWISVIFFLTSWECCFLQTTSKIVYVRSQSRLALAAIYTALLSPATEGAESDKAAAQTNQTWQEITISAGNFSFIYDASNARRVPCTINRERHYLWAVYTTAASCEAN